MITIGILFFSTIVNLYEGNDKIDDLINNGVLISDYFMSSGYLPEEWDSSEGRIGFVDNGRINLENLTFFSDLFSVGEGYTKSKYLLGTSYDYVLYFEDSEGVLDITGDLVITEDDFLGDLDIASSDDITNMNTDHMVRLIRFVYYYDEFVGINKFVKMVVVLWD